jgi:hypothetical protein
MIAQPGDEQIGYASGRGFDFAAFTQLGGTEAEWEERVRGGYEHSRGRARIVGAELAEALTFLQHCGKDLRLLREVPLPAFHDAGAEVAQHFAEADAEGRGRIETQHDATDKHGAQAIGGGAILRGDGVELCKERPHNAVDVREHHFLFAGEVQVDSAFADARFPGDVFDGHLFVTEVRQQPVRGVEDELSATFAWSNATRPHLWPD